MNKMIVAAMCLVALSGCATVMNDSTHPVRLETKTQDGELVAGADCMAANDKAIVRGRSGDTIQVRRSSKDLDITCKMDGFPLATARAISRTNAGMWGNILIGGAIGAIVDHNKGTAYTYPTWVQLVFGKTLTFDRRDEDGEGPVAATEIEGAGTYAVQEVATPSEQRPDADASTLLRQKPYQADPAKRCDACKNLSIP